MIKSVVGCWGGRLRVNEGSVWGEYCVGEGKWVERGGVRLIWGRVVVLQGGSALRECNLVNGREAVERRDVKRRKRKQERVKLGGWGRIEGGDSGCREERERGAEES